MYWCKVGLEDLIEFHDAQFEIIDGYYYTGGRNETINHVIEYLNNVRLKLTKKKSKNPAQVAIKLLKGSMYGKTIIQPVETYTIIKGNKHDSGKLSFV